MASWYVYSGAAGTASGADWANAKTTLAAAISAGAAGDTYYVAHDHNESGVTVTITFKGGASNPDKVLCVSRSGSVPPVSADLTKRGGTITASGALSLQESAYVYGLNLVSSSGSASAIRLGSSRHSLKLEACLLKLTSGSTASIGIGHASSTNFQKTVELVDTQMQFGATGDTVSVDEGRFIWRDTASAIQGATLPTTLFTASNNCGGTLVVDGVDLSALGSGKTLVATTAPPGKVTFINPKLGSSVTVAATPTTGPGGVQIDLINGDSSGTGYRQERYWYEGTLTTETTIVRTAGASDGAQAISHKIVTSANANQMFPFEAFEGAIWVDTTGSSKTLTVHTITDNVTLKNNELWIEAQVLDASGAPLATLYSSGVDVLAAGSNNTSDSGEAWTTTGLTTPVKQSVAVTFTTQIKGYVRWIVKVAKASTTVYVCDKAAVA